MKENQYIYDDLYQKMFDEEQFDNIDKSIITRVN
jgi:hypothetical protein